AGAGKSAAGAVERGAAAEGRAEQEGGGDERAPQQAHEAHVVIGGPIGRLGEWRGFPQEHAGTSEEDQDPCEGALEVTHAPQEGARQGVPEEAARRSEGLRLLACCSRSRTRTRTRG